MAPRSRRRQASSTWHGRAVGQRVEGVDAAAAERVDEPLDQPPVQAAHESGLASASSRNGQWVKATVALLAVVGHGGVEAEGVEPGDQRRQARRRRVAVGRQRAAVGIGLALLAPGLDRLARRRGRRRAASRSSMRASTGNVAGSRPSDGASAASE